MRTVKGLVWINFFVAGWLMFTSWSVPDDRLALESRVEAAAALVLAALAAWTLVSEADRPVALWLQMLAGAALAIAPFVLGYNPWNDVLTGLMAISVAVLAAHREYATVD